jgi:hypothetical protein
LKCYIDTQINVVIIYNSDYITNFNDLDICCQEHGPEQCLKDFSRRLLFVEKLLTKEVLKIERNFTTPCTFRCELYGFVETVLRRLEDIGVVMPM